MKYGRTGIAAVLIVAAALAPEAQIWAGLSASGATTIRFRKARYIAAVTAPSKTIAARVAKLVAAQLYE